MKKSLTKLIVSCAAVTAVAAAMAVSASAANYADGKVTLAADKTIPTADGAQTTILVYKAESATDEASVTEGNIKYINQDTKEAIKNIVADGIPVGTLTVPAEGTEKYIIKIGGQNVTTITSDDFTLGQTVTPPAGETVDRRLGDVKVDGRITNADALAILRHIGECSEDCLIKADKNSFTVADVKVDGRITNADALTILRHIAGDCDSATCVVDTIQALPADKED